MKTKKYSKNDCPKCKGKGFYYTGADAVTVGCDHIVKIYTAKEQYDNNLFRQCIWMSESKPPKNIILDSDVIWVWNGSVIHHMTGKDARKQWNKTYSWCHRDSIKMRDTE